MPGSIVSGIFGNKAAKTQAKAAGKAADTTLEATRLAIESQEGMFERSIELSEPWRATGESALDALGFETGIGERPESYAGFQETPGYQFQLDEGQRAINRSLAARGKVLSGPAVKEGLRFSQGLADQTYSNHLKRLANMAGLGSDAAQGGANAVATGQGIANSQLVGGAGVADAQIQAGNARASGYAATGQAISGGFNFLGGLASGGTFGSTIKGFF